MQKKKTAADYEALAALKNIVWVPEPLTNVRTPVQWRCPKCGYTWKAKYGNIITKAFGCSKCKPPNKGVPSPYKGKPRQWGNMSPGYRDYVKTGLSHSYIWLGIRPPLRSKPTKWLCDNHHIFEASYSNIGNGYKCPDCRKRSHHKAVAVSAPEVGVVVDI